MAYLTRRIIEARRGLRVNGCSLAGCADGLLAHEEAALRFSGRVTLPPEPLENLQQLALSADGPRQFTFFLKLAISISQCSIPMSAQILGHANQGVGIGIGLMLDGIH